MKAMIWNRNLSVVKNSLLRTVIMAMLFVAFALSAKAQKRVHVEWDYTYTPGLSCRYPMVVNIYYILSDGSNYEFGIFNHPTYNGTEGQPNIGSSKSYTITLPAGVTITALRIAAGYVNNQGGCPGLPAGRLCYTGGVFEINRNENDYCVWPETAPVLCGLTNFKVRTNIFPYNGYGPSLVQLGTPKPYYCPDETITYEVPCNLKGQGYTFNWYYAEGTGSRKLLKTTTSESITIGEGYDLTPKPGVSTTISVTASGAVTPAPAAPFRYGAHAPTATVDPRPPRCADGDDWSINIDGVSSSDAVITSFKANIYHTSNSTVFPDGFVTFNGSSGTITKADIANIGIFAPGSTFRVTIQNDFNPTLYGSCETALPGTYSIPNTPKISIVENALAHKNLSCYNVLTGEFQVNVSNGDGNYTVELNNVAFPIKSGSPTHQPIVEKLDGGVYSVKVKDTYCVTDPISITLNEPTELTANVTIEKMLDCANSQDGELKVNIAGGTLPYTINWSNGSTSVIATGLSKGLYSVTVLDQGCPAIVASETLFAPDPIIVTLSDTPPKCPGRPDGSMRVSNLQNAPGVIEYLWSTGETSSEITSIGSGNYSVTVTSKDAGKTCSVTASKDLKDPPSWTALITPLLGFNGSAISCNGEDDGRLDVLVKNDLNQVVDGEYYTWSTGVSGASRKYIDQLSEGTYTITVRYNSVCEAVASFALLDPDPVVSSIVPNLDYNGQLISCHDQNDASIKVTTTGGTGIPSAFTYTWSTGATGSVLSGVGAGSYGINVKDVNGCIGTDNLTIDNPDLVEAFIVSSSDYTGYGVSCAGASDGYITAGASGGTDTFDYVWSSGQNSAFVNSLSAGDYSVMVSDNNGCQAIATHRVESPDAVNLQVNSLKNISCFNGNDGWISLQAGGGTTQYEYSRDNVAWQSSPTFAGLQIGTYTLYTRDQNNCRVNINESLIQPSQITISFADIAPAFCSNPIGKATGIVNGGVGDYQYAWRENGQTQVIGTTDQLASVLAGIYRLYITDGNSCLADNTVAITSTDGAKTTYSSIDAKCFDSADGSAEITITDGEGPFGIQWPDGQSALQGANLKKGLYDVIITDVRSCKVVQTVVVNAPNEIRLSIKDQIAPTCNTFCDGTMTLEATGGVGSYGYEWNNTTGAAQTKLCAGIYPVVIRDANGCFIREDVVLSEPDPIAVEPATFTLATCKDGCDGSLEVLATGGNGGYQYSWAVGGNANFKTNICPGSYVIAVVDQKGCEGNGTIQLPNTPALPLDLGGGVTLCVGQTYILNAGNNWPTVTWGSNTGFTSSNASITIKEAGSYWVDIVNNKGCVAQDTFLLETSYDLLKAAFMLTTEAIVGDTVVMIDISWPLPESIQWTYPQEMKEIFDLGDVVMGQFNETGTYDVSLTAHLGECVDELTKTITILKAQDGSTGGRLGYEEFVTAFTLFPNPNDGSFDVGVELMEKSAITLSVWNATTSVLLGKINDAGQSSYFRHVDLRPLSSGSYILRLDHEKGKEYIRFIVH